MDSALIDLTELRAALIEELGVELGTYTYSTGLTTPAIRVDDGSDPYDEEPAVAGLECVIQRGVEVSVTPIFGDSYRQDWTTAIALKQWDVQETTLSAMHHTIVALRQFNVVPTVKRLPRTNRLKNIETCLIQFVESEAIKV